jgi:hypothetical protein
MKEWLIKALGGYTELDHERLVIQKDGCCDNMSFMRRSADKAIKELEDGGIAYVYDVPVVKYKPHHSTKQKRIKGKFA